MKSAIFASALALASADYESYKAKYGKVYNGEEEDEQHRATYKLNIKMYKESNKLGLPYQLGPNQFTDLTQEQYKVQAGLGHLPLDPDDYPLVLGPHYHDGEDLADYVDWVSRGAVTPIKDQGQCGSCWSFGTTGGIEGAWQIASGSLTSVSEQQLVDCSLRNLGCQGGNAAWAINYEKGVNLATETSYPYKATKGTCEADFATAIPQGGVTGYKSVGKNFAIFFLPATIPDMMSALQQQPVSIAIQADQTSFQSYKNGVLTDGCGQQLDHAVLAVGYGQKSGNDYWLVKNSWGTSWGSEGYIKIGRGEENLCGVLSQPIYPVVSASVTV